MKINPSDAAFPTEATKWQGQINNGATGLTKREYFAALAMQGICNHEMTYGIFNKPSTGQTWRTERCSELAWYSVEMADALIKELSK